MSDLPVWRFVGAIVFWIAGITLTNWAVNQKGRTHAAGMVAAALLMVIGTLIGYLGQL